MSYLSGQVQHRYRAYNIINEIHNDFQYLHTYNQDHRSRPMWKSSVETYRIQICTILGFLKKNFRDLRQETKTACSIPFVPIELEPVTLSRAVCYVICNAAQSAITFCTVSGMMILLKNYFQYFSNNIYTNFSFIQFYTYSHFDRACR